MRIAICGGGNVAHVLAGLLSQKKGLEIRVLTRKPGLWGESIRVLDDQNRSTTGRPHLISNQASEVIPGADLVILTLPAYARAAVLETVAPHLTGNVWVGSFPGSGGFDWLAQKALQGASASVSIFGAQRVPYISRIIHYGREVFGSPKKEGIAIASIPQSRCSEIASILEEILQMPVSCLNNFLEITLATSNPILHPPRMYTLFRDYEKGRSWQEPILFYEGWDDAASELLIRMDREVHDIFARIPLDLSYILPLLEHYGVGNAQELTRKICGIASFRGIPTPMLKTEDGFIPDFQSRYFTEDIPFGLLIIKGVAAITDTTTPAIDTVLTWTQEMMHKEYIVGGKLGGKDIAETPIPQNAGIVTTAELVRQATL
ncbi:NAD/NADP octopine/nopaline dehydrogenase [bacterium endosymbiont of Escarpia laminata]|nr:MAG: NAD/NADP octopine/nopaline dehydrogenase [bacterium endosymbiont of Escarpia laminata]RLJ22730.1 MAG: NAD/NADP octopine/nopaline dehydrogenase [bacterium endosymbiont of Escarpia laminata]